MSNSNNITITLCLDIPKLNINDNIVIKLPNNENEIEKEKPEEPKSEKSFFNELFEKTSSTNLNNVYDDVNNEPSKKSVPSVIDYKYIEPQPLSPPQQIQRQIPIFSPPPPQPPPQLPQLPLQSSQPIYLQPMQPLQPQIIYSQPLPPPPPPQPQRIMVHSQPQPQQIQYLYPFYNFIQYHPINQCIQNFQKIQQEQYLFNMNYLKDLQQKFF